MIIVARIDSKKVLSRYDAWERNAYENAPQDIKDNGYDYICEDITMMGDMIIWVKERR